MMAEEFSLYVCWGDSSTDNHPRGDTISLERLEARLQRHELGTKDGSYFIPCRFSHENTRLQDDVDLLYGFVIDLDEGNLSIDDIAGSMPDIRYVVYSTYSATPDNRKWRIFVPYKAPITRSRHLSIYQFFRGLFGERIDKRSETLNQLWFLPRIPEPINGEAGYCETFAHNGPLFDAERFSEQPYAEPSPGPETASDSFGDAQAPPKSERNNYLIHYVGTLPLYMLTDGQISDLVLAENARLNPPLSEHEVWRTVLKSARKYAGQARTAWQEHQQILDTLFIAPTEAEAMLEPIRWLVRGALMSQGVNYLGGNSFVGKSLLAIDWHLHVAWGQDWHGHTVKPATVFYIAQEGRRGIPLRMQAWSQVRDKSLRELPFYFTRWFVDLMADETTLEVANRMRELVPEGDIAVVVDTQAASMPGQDENQAGDISSFLNRLRTFLVDERGMTVTVLHHTPKSSPWELRGSGAIRGSAEVVCMLGLPEEEKYRGLVQLKPDKLRDGTPLPEVYFQPTAVQLLYPGTDQPLLDEDGHWESSAVLKPMDDVALAQYSPDRDDQFTQAVLEIVYKYPGATLRFIRSKASKRHSEVKDKVVELVSQGLIEDRGSEGKSAYFLTDAGQFRLSEYQS